MRLTCGPPRRTGSDGHKLYHKLFQRSVRMQLTARRDGPERVEKIGPNNPEQFLHKFAHLHEQNEYNLLLNCAHLVHPNLGKKGLICLPLKSGSFDLNAHY